MTMRRETLRRIEDLEESLAAGHSLAKMLHDYAETGELPDHRALSKRVQALARYIEQTTAAVRATIPADAPEDGDDWGA